MSNSLIALLVSKVFAIISSKKKMTEHNVILWQLYPYILLQDRRVINRLAKFPAKKYSQEEITFPICGLKTSLATSLSNVPIIILNEREEFLQREMQRGKALFDVKAFPKHDIKSCVLVHPDPSMISGAWVLSSGISLQKIHFLLRGYIRSGNISSQPGLVQKYALSKSSNHHGYRQHQLHHCDEHESIFTPIFGKIN